MHPPQASASPGLHSVTIAVTNVGPDSPLMQVGLTSTAAVRLASQLRARSGLALPPTLIFEHPTPRAIAMHLSTLAAPDELTKVEALVALIKDELIQRRPVTSPQNITLPKALFNVQAGVLAAARLPCSSMQHQLLLHQMMAPRSTAYNEPVTVTIAAQLTEPKARDALQALVRRHAVRAIR